MRSVFNEHKIELVKQISQWISIVQRSHPVSRGNWMCLCWVPCLFCAGLPYCRVSRLSYLLFCITHGIAAVLRCWLILIALSNVFIVTPSLGQGSTSVTHHWHQLVCLVCMCACACACACACESESECVWVCVCVCVCVRARARAQGRPTRISSYVIC